MIDVRDQAVLQDVLRREGRSLLQYVSEAFPWTTAEHLATRERLTALAKREREAVAALARFLSRRRVTPLPLGAFPTHFTSINFVSLDHLVPRLILAQREAILRLEAELPAVQDAEARAALQAFLDVKRTGLADLEALDKLQPAAVAH